MLTYLLVMYGEIAAWEAMPEDERDEALRLHAALVEELEASGELISGAGIAGAEKTVTVGDPADAEAGRQMSAFYLIECATLERARSIAERVLDPHVRTVEIRLVHSVT